MRLCILFICLMSCLSAKIPPHIWQTYKTTNLPMSALEAHSTWVSLNREFSCHVFDDLDIELYMQQHWPSSFLTCFRALPIGAMKADLWRYLILASEGGVYSDIDSVCLLPIRHWPLTESGHMLLLDLDCDQSQFCQWTLAATPNHPAMQYVCYYVLSQWQKQGLLIDTDGKINVLNTTGPKIFTRAIKSYLGESPDVGACDILKKYERDAQYRKRLNVLGIFFTNKGFFSGEGSKNLFWGSWAHRSAE